MNIDSIPETQRLSTIPTVIIRIYFFKKPQPPQETKEEILVKLNVAD